MSALIDVTQGLAREGRSLFLGWKGNTPVFGKSNEQLTVIGPPRSGKSSAIFAPSIAAHPGPVIVTSVRAAGMNPDLRDVTLDARLQIADGFGGTVEELVLDESITPKSSAVWWDMTSGCSTWNGSLDRARLIAGAAIPMSQDNALSWRNSVVSLLGPLLHMAALNSWRDTDLRSYLPSSALNGLDGPSFLMVRNWLAEYYRADHPAVLSCDAHLAATPEVQSNVRYVVETDVLGVLSYTRDAEPAPFDIQRFLAGWGTLYITVRSTRAAQVCALISGLIGALADGWQSKPYSPARGTLLLALDEVANVAPVADLPRIVAEGGGYGIQCILGFQDPAQAVARWGPGDADAIVQTAANTIIFPGLTNTGFLRDMATLFGEKVQYQREVHVAPGSPSAARGANVAQLIREREQLETALAGVEPRLRSVAERLTAQQIMMDRRVRGVHFLQDNDEETAAARLVTELRQHTDVRERAFRRPILEAGDIFKGKPRAVFVKTLNGARMPDFDFHNVLGWYEDPFWSQLITVA